MLPGLAALAAAVKKNATLRSLGLARNGIGLQGNAGFEALAKALQGNKGLHRIDLRHNQMGPSAAEAFAQGMRGSQLRIVDLSFNEIGAVGAMAVLQEVPSCTQLAKLLLQSNSIYGTCAGHLLACSALSSSVGDGEAGEEIESELDLRWNFLGRLSANKDTTANTYTDQAAVALAAMLEASECKLQIVRLEANCLSSDAVAMVCAALAANTSVTTASLAHNFCGPETTERVAASLRISNPISALKEVRHCSPVPSCCC